MEPSSIPDEKATADRRFEQYKLAVEMWDRIRERRQRFNTFYATINAALVAAIAAKEVGAAISISITAAGTLLSALWFVNILRYRAINHAKLAVITGIEQGMQNKLPLPLQPFSDEKCRTDTHNLLLTTTEIIISFIFFI